MEDEFPCVVCRKVVDNNFIIVQFYACYLHERCSSIRNKLKEDSNFKCQTCANQQTDLAEDC